MIPLAPSVQHSAFDNKVVWSMSQSHNLRYDSLLNQVWQAYPNLTNLPAPEKNTIYAIPILVGLCTDIQFHLTPDDEPALYNLRTFWEYAKSEPEATNILSAFRQLIDPAIYREWWVAHDKADPKQFHAPIELQTDIAPEGEDAESFLADETPSSLKSTPKSKVMPSAKTA